MLFFAISDDFQHLTSIEHIRMWKRYWDVGGYNTYQYIFDIQLCSVLAKCWKFSKMQKMTWFRSFIQI